ncbi:MAG TPA: hypothetical protein VGC29_11980 [Flavisolibacter sp.]
MTIAILMMAAFLPFNSSAQDLTGIWRGTFETFAGEVYKFELQIDQSGTNRISGVSYSYLDVRFYGKATLTGYFTKGSGSALIQEIKTIEVKSSSGDGACIMKCQLNFTKMGKEEFLDGTYTSVEEGSDPPRNCGGGIVNLRRVTTSDFYIEPFLRKTTPPVTEKKPEPKKQVTKPVTKPPTKPVVKKPVDDNKPKVDTVAKKTAPVIIDKPVNKPVFNIPAKTRSRENALVQTLHISSEEISVRLYDNGEIDGDTISVYLDGQAIVSKKGLSTSPITVKLKMDENNPEHVLIMVAENLGSIPPNTSLMIVQDGDKRYQVSITSTEQKNAMVRFRYQKKGS